MKTIVVGYDDTEPAKRALERAAELSKAFDAELIVASIAPALAPSAHGIGPIDPADPPEAHREQLRHAEAMLAERGVAADFQPALGDPADTIVHVADERGADLVVVGTREPGLVARLLGQSVSGAVQRKAHCDVLIVHEQRGGAA
jgi:nucleotide-binding universal stress UspA family protein